MGEAILRIDLKWREMQSKVIFSHPKWPICEQIIPKLRIDLPWPIENEFQSLQV